MHYLTTLDAAHVENVLAEPRPPEPSSVGFPKGLPAPQIFTPERRYEARS